MRRSRSDAALLALAALVVAPACTTEKGYGKKNPDFLVVGHRGAPLVAAENTIPAFDAALEQGAAGIETDLCVTADREIVIWHDRDPDDLVAVARQSGLEALAYVPFVPPDGSPSHRPVDQLTLADFLATHGYARASSPGTRDPAASIPTLAEFLAWAAAAPDLRVLYLDVKLAPTQAELATFVFEALVAAWDADPRLAAIPTYVICPHRAIVEAMIAARDRTFTTHFTLVWDFEGPGSLAGAGALGLRDVSTGITPVRTESEYFDEIESLVDARKKGDLDTITAWTIDRETQMFRILYYGVDAALTNDPALLHAYWQDTLN